MPGIRRSRHILATTLAAVSAATALSACGSSATSSGAGAGVPDVAGIKFADCMRSHGVPSFPDPGPDGGFSGGSVNPQSPAFLAAQTDCAKLLPLPGGGRTISESRRLAMLRLSRCMRRQGLSSFPDPTGSPPPPGSGFGIAFGAPGSYIAVPSSMMQSPAFKQAGAACGFPGLGRSGGAKAASLGS